jgi:hypothetical protein
MSLPVEPCGCRIAAQYRLLAITPTGDTWHEFHVPATGPSTAQDASRGPGRDLALAYSPNCNVEAVLRRARYTLRRDIRPDAVALPRKACAVPAAIRSVPRPTLSLPTAPAANAGADITIVAITTANNPNAPRWARAQHRNRSMKPGTTISPLSRVWGRPSPLER